MKKSLLFLMLFPLLFVILSSSDNSFRSISYTESSSGLQSINLDGGRTEIEMSDINRDGHIDFLSIGDHGNPNINTSEHGIMVWFGNGSGSNWVLFQNGNFGYGGIAIGDVNGDGIPDAAYAMHHNYSSNDFGNQLIEAALGDGTGMNWTPWDDSLATHGETYGMFSTDFGDFDNDGLLDIGSVSFGCCAGVHMYKNLGTGTWRQTFGFTGGNCSMDMILGDINNDGSLDFAVAHSFGTPYFGDGTGNFILRQNNLPAPGNSGYRGVSLGDVNNDGAKDLAFIESASPNNGRLNVWKWNNVSQSWDNLSGSLPTNSAYAATSLYDMNMDGNADLVVFGSGTVTIWAGNGGTSWTQIANFTSHSSPGGCADMTVGDADHNGFADLVVEASQSCGTFCDRNIIKLFKESTPFTNLTVTPMFPRGNEWFKNNSVQFVDWLSAAPQAQTSKVKLELSSTGNNGPWTLIADSLPNNSRRQWTTPTGVNSPNCYIRYTAFIPGGPSVTATTPNAFIIGTPVGIKTENQTPTGFHLYQNYPNPFNPSTKIKFSIPPSKGDRGMNVRLNIYNALGKEIETLVNENLQPGAYEAEWNAWNFPSGVYYYTLKGGDFSETKKMLLIK
jgi:VCBS repeat protein/type IX secretion system substrate protein